MSVGQMLKDRVGIFLHAGGSKRHFHPISTSSKAQHDMLSRPEGKGPGCIPSPVCTMYDRRSHPASCSPFWRRAICWPRVLKNGQGGHVARLLRIPAPPPHSCKQSQNACHISAKSWSSTSDIHYHGVIDSFSSTVKFAHAGACKSLFFNE
jgi:hypothetical protein